MSTVSNYVQGLPAATTAALLYQISGLAYIKTSIGGYFFDAIFRTTHSTQMKITSHPVQGGANVSDHCYLEPVSLSIELGMSDANLPIISEQFKDSDSRALAAFNALRKMQQDRLLITIVTRFATYENMLIERLVIPDDLKSANGMRASLSLKQVIVVDVPEVVNVSARNQTTGSVASGQVATVTPKETLASKIETAMEGN